MIFQDNQVVWGLNRKPHTRIVALDSLHVAFANYYGKIAVRGFGGRSPSWGLGVSGLCGPSHQCPPAPCISNVVQSTKRPDITSVPMARKENQMHGNH